MDDLLFNWGNKLAKRLKKLLPFTISVALMSMCWASGATSTWAQALPTMTSPTPGSTLAGSSATFVWQDHGTPVTNWWLYVGSSAGAADLHDSGDLGTNLSTTVAGLPTDGRTLHAQLWYKDGQGPWESILVQYTAATVGGSPPTITSPTPGSTLAGSSATFVWQDNGTPVTNWWLYVGSSAGAADLHDSGDLGTNVSTTVGGLPTDGRTLHAQLWYKDGQGTWESISVQYTAATVGGSPPTITSPTPGSTLAGSSATFVWQDNGTPVTNWWLYVGSSAGAADLHNSGDLGSNLSTTVGGLPTDGRTLHAQLWYKEGQGTWESISVQYTAATVGVSTPTITSPTPGSTLAGSSATFVWQDNGTPVTNWWLYVGSSAGAADLHDSGDLGTNVSTTVGGIPTDERTLHVKLWYKDGQGPWESISVQYTAATGGGSSPTITSPTPGSTLAGSTATFVWEDNGTPVTEWWLYVGSQVGSADILDSGSLGLNLSTFVVGLPTNGEVVHVRLWYAVGGVWLFTDFQFTAATFVVVDYYVALGDSITFGLHHDNVPFDDVSYDGRNSGGGYEPVLNNLLTAVKGYGHTVENEGISGDQAIDGVNRIQDVLADHPGSTHFLIQYGTNDSWDPLPTPSGLDLPCTGLNMPNNHPDCPGSFKDNMLRIINAVRGAGKNPLLAKVPPRYGNCGFFPQCSPFPDPSTAPENTVTISTFNLVIDQLILEEFLESQPGTLLIPPDFFTYFEGTGVDSSGKSPEFDDYLHPDGIGMRSMAELWCKALTNSNSLCNLP